jgi:hypothetical protein
VYTQLADGAWHAVGALRCSQGSSAITLHVTCIHAAQLPLLPPALTPGSAALLRAQQQADAFFATLPEVQKPAARALLQKQAGSQHLQLPVLAPLPSPAVQHHLDALQRSAREKWQTLCSPARSQRPSAPAVQAVRFELRDGHLAHLAIPSFAGVERMTPAAAAAAAIAASANLLALQAHAQVQSYRSSALCAFCCGSEVIAH